MKTYGINIDPAAWELLSDPIWVFDPHAFRMVWANARAIAFWRAESLEDLRARDMSQVSDMARARLRGYIENLGDAEAFVEEHWTLYPKGKPVTVRVRARGLIGENDSILLLFHVVSVLGGDFLLEQPDDPELLSEELREARGQLTQAEARFRAFAEAGSDWLWETDVEHKFSFFSAGVYTHYGNGVTDHIGMTRRQVFERIGVNTDSTSSRAKWDAHENDLDRRRVFRDFEYGYRRGDGKVRFAAISGDPMYDSHGRFLGYRGIGRDITARYESEARFRQVERERDMALAAKAASSQMLATMSHELRTPLNAILGFSEIMSLEMFGPSGNPIYQEYATGIHDSARHLLDVVDDLLDASRIDLGEIALDVERFEADHLLGSVVRMTNHLAHARDVSLEYNLSDPALQMDADLRAMRQVLLNLVANAIKFSSPGSTIEIGCACLESGELDLFVRDTGAGIDPELVPFLFEPFRTADPHVAKREGGVGLGLWICKRIVTAHGGTISIESMPGEGTTVHVMLPPGGYAVAEEIPAAAGE